MSLSVCRACGREYGHARDCPYWTPPTPPALPDEAGEMVRSLREATDALIAETTHETVLRMLHIADEAASLIERLSPRWISVEERLPEPQKMVLLHIPDSHRGPVSYGFLDFATRKFMIQVSSSYGWMTLEGRDGVQHWQPLPLPPQKGST